MTHPHVHDSADLKKAIEDLELRKNNSEELLKLHFRDTLETFRPSNILKNTVSEVSESMDFKKNLLNLAIGVGTGLLTKGLVTGKSTGIGRQILGSVLELGMGAFAARKADDLTSSQPKREGLLSRIFGKSDRSRNPG
ncbi:hypothetical protein BH09BAC2_BH09BAC2_06910 [soil metagenome]